MKVSSKGQVTIPKWVRDTLGIGPGGSVDFVRDRDGRVGLVKINEKPQPRNLVGLRGHAGKGLSTEEIMAMTRSEE
jgi:AbrB family looped-hinge helix DNA binding protein